MKRIIALRGVGNSGKTTTIWQLRDILPARGYPQIPGSFVDHGRDFSESFERNGARVGITSAGDAYDLVHDRVQELIDSHCEIIVCACRSRDNGDHGTNAAINTFSPPYVIRFIEKIREPDQTLRVVANMNSAEELFRNIEL